MEIKLPVQTSLLKSQSSNAHGDNLSLELHQRVEAKVLETQVTQNRIILAIADKTVTVQSQEPIVLSKGQQLDLQVSRLIPYPVFTLQTKRSGTDNQDSALKSVAPPLLTVIKSINTPAPESKVFRMDKLVENQILMATVIQIDKGKISVQLNSSLKPTNASFSLIGQTPIVTLESTQLIFDPKFNLNQEKSSLLSLSTASSQVITDTNFDAVTDQPKALASTTSRTLGQSPFGPLALKIGMFISLKAMNIESGDPTQYLVVIDELPASGTQPRPLSTFQNNFDRAKIIDINHEKVSLEIIGNTLGDNKNPNAATSTRATLQLDLKQLLSADSLSKTLPSVTETLNLKPGMQISLEVIETGTKPKFSLGLSLGNQQDTIIEAQRRLLPLQASSQSLLGVLMHWQKNGIADHEVADTLHRLANAILQNLPDPAQLAEPSRLKQSIANSGVFMESTLAELLKGQLDRLSPEDFKFKLSHLIDELKQQLDQAHLKQSSPELLDTLRDGIKKTESLLARITLNQLNSLPQDDASRQTWIVELPFHDHQQYQQLDIAIQQDSENSPTQATKGWGVSITLTPPDLGTIHCKISCYDGSINTRFWSESAATVDKIAMHLDYLQQQLESKGLMTGHMDAYQGKPSTNETTQKKPTQLLNVKA